MPYVFVFALVIVFCCLYNALGRSCITMLNKIGSIIEPRGIPVLFKKKKKSDEYVLPTRVQIHLSDKILIFFFF